MSETSPSRLPLPHLLLAVAIVALWGTNFVVTHQALQHFPPLTLGALRFLLSSVPLVLLVPPPRGAWRNLAAFGVLMGGQYSLLYLAMRRDISPGLASVVLQIQVIFSVGLAVLISREAPRPFQWLALGMSMSGLALIALRAGAAATPLGIGLVVGAALCWGAANTVVRRASGMNPFVYIAWASLLASPFVLVLAIVVEGWPAVIEAVRAADGSAWAAVLWQAYANNVLGFGVWAWLLARNTAANVTSVALLVPVFGLGASAAILNEPLQPWKTVAALLVVGGLAVNQLWDQARVRIGLNPSKTKSSNPLERT